MYRKALLVQQKWLISKCINNVQSDLPSLCLFENTFCSFHSCFKVLCRNSRSLTVNPHAADLCILRVAVRKTKMNWNDTVPTVSFWAAVIGWSFPVFMFWTHWNYGLVCEKAEQTSREEPDQKHPMTVWGDSTEAAPEKLLKKHSSERWSTNPQTVKVPMGQCGEAQMGQR